MGLSKPSSKQTPQFSLSQIAFCFHFCQHNILPPEIILNFELTIDYCRSKEIQAKFYLQHQKLARIKKYLPKTKRHSSCCWSCCHRIMNNDSLKSKTGNIRKKLDYSMDIFSCSIANGYCGCQRTLKPLVKMFH